MTLQTTLLTGHKGVDLHAASALRVMKARLEGGERLANLLRCELHTFWGSPADLDIARLLDQGRFFNPNKHHYGAFTLAGEGAPWFDCADCRGRALPAGWPGEPVGTDLTGTAGAGDLYHRLLGGRPTPEHTAVDIVSFELGQTGPVLSGVLWRLLVTGDAATAPAVGLSLAVARSRKQGLLVNPHMEAWLTVEQEQK